ncbi:hypothetical protein Tco_0354808 [Tanacetum coccineum]
MKLTADYRKTSGSITGGKSPGVINRLLRDSQLTVDSLIRSVAPVMTVATTVTTSVSAAATTTVTPADVGKDKNVSTPFGEDGSHA